MRLASIMVPPQGSPGGATREVEDQVADIVVVISDRSRQTIKPTAQASNDLDADAWKSST